MQQELKHNIRKRMEFIEFALYWEGKIGRKRLQDHFAISPQQASNDLNGYIDIASDNIHYDLRKKTYVPSSNFSAVFIQVKSQDYLRQLQSYSQGYLNDEDIWIDYIPPVETAYIPTREVAPNFLQCVLFAIRYQYSIEIQYVSLRSKEVSERKVTPHALGTDGQRWHMRAFDHTKNRYADFVLTRIINITKFEPSDIDGSHDKVWKTIVELRLEPDPNLAKEIRNVIAKEYNMNDGILSKQVSQAMLFYFLRQYGFNPVPAEGGKMKNESSYHLSLCDYDDVEIWLERRQDQM